MEEKEQLFNMLSDDEEAFIEIKRDKNMPLLTRLSWLLRFTEGVDSGPNRAVKVDIGICYRKGRVEIVPSGVYFTSCVML